MTTDKCPYHDQLALDVSGIAKDVSTLLQNSALNQKDVEYLRRDQETILARFGKHIEDAEKEGGRHERLKKAEDDILAIKTQRREDLIMSRWFMIGSGIIGGGIVSGAIRFWGILSKILGV